MKNDMKNISTFMMNLTGVYEGQLLLQGQPLVLLTDIIYITKAENQNVFANVEKYILIIKQVVQDQKCTYICVYTMCFNNSCGHNKFN